MEEATLKSFAERGWDERLDLPLCLRRGLSGIYIFDTFPGERKRQPTCLEDCTAAKRDEWLRGVEPECRARTRDLLLKVWDDVLAMLDDSERAEVLGSASHIGRSSSVEDICNAITLVADIFGICAKDTEAQTAYDERAERRKNGK